jgi:hypothetical protein
MLRLLTDRLAQVQQVGRVGLAEQTWQALHGTT